MSFKAIIMIININNFITTNYLFFLIKAYLFIIIQDLLLIYTHYFCIRINFYNNQLIYSLIAFIILYFLTFLL